MNTNTATPEALVKTGLAHWSQIHGTDIDHALALTASIFSGLAGPGPILGQPWGNTPVPALNLLLQETASNTSSALETLLHPVRQFNRRVLETMAGTNRLMLEHLHFGTFATDPAKANPLGNTESVVLRDLRQKAHTDKYEEISSLSDLNPAANTLRRDSMLHPAVWLEGARFDHLKQLVRGCHRFTALAILKLTPALDAPNREAQLEALIELLDGCEILIPQNKHTLGIEPHRQAKLHTIMRLDRQAWERIYFEAPQLLDRTLLIPNNGPAVFAANTEAATLFQHAYLRSIKTIGVTRRNGSTIEVEFSDPEAAVRFQKQVHEHAAACDAMAFDVGSTARNLPVVLAWTMLILSQHLGDYAPPAEDQIIDASFEVSRRLVARHHQCLETMATASKRATMLALASQLVRKVRDKQPIGERDLARCFNDQRMTRYRPVIEVLVHAQVLELTPASLLQLGPQQFEEVRAGLALPALELKADNSPGPPADAPDAPDAPDADV